MAAKAREEDDMYPTVRPLHLRRFPDDERIAAREIRDDLRARDCIVERPRWFEDLARPPFKRRESLVAEVGRR
jgi:hypothetical protein